MSSSTDFLMGGGTTAAKFETVGDTVKGTVVSTEVRQQTDIQTREPLTWPNGDPRMQLVVTLATDIRDDPDDDGHRTLFVKGSKARGSQSLHDAIRTAVENAGAKSLEEGGTLTVSHTGTEPPKTRGFSDRKLYQATYQPPAAGGGASEFLGATGQPAQQPAQQPTQQQSAPPSSSSGDTADKVKQLINLGLDDAQIAGATGLDASTVTAIRQVA